MALEVEDVVDGSVGGNEALSLALRLEPLHLPFFSANRKMRVLGPVVVAQSAGLVPVLALQNLQGGTVGRQPIGDDLVGNAALVFSAAS